MDQLLTDLRYAIRTWRRNPGFVIVAIVTLALGIGANSTIFSVVNATLLRPLSFPDADRLMTVWKASIRDPSDINIISMPNYKEWRQRSRSFASLAIFDSAGRGYNLTGIAEPEQVSGVRVTASFFDVLGVPPLLGRTFRPEEEEPGSESRRRPELRPLDAQLRRRSIDRRQANPDRRRPVYRRRRHARELPFSVLERRARAVGACQLDGRRPGSGIEFIHLHRPPEARRDTGAGPQ